MADTQILVLGGGPAGASVAIGLKRLGYEVTLVGEPRPFDAIEGVSDRVVEGMRHAGFERALTTLAAPSARSVTWNGETSAANTERLIVRQRFDRALVEDLRGSGVRVIQGRVTAMASQEAGFSVSVVGDDGSEHCVEAGFLVEARGRAAPASGVPRVRGAQSVSLLQHWQGAAGTPCSAVQSFADGWAWMAKREDGRRYLQLTLDVASSRLPPKQQLGQWCYERLSGLEQAQPFMEGAEPVGEVYARTSTPVLCEHSAGDNWLRVGDAAMAVDPLSGNGIFQALSSALQAPAVINTLIRHPERAALAKAFHETRIEQLFYRFARIGRDFYDQESQWPEHPFWRARRAWPDSQPLHLEVTPDRVSTGVRPVVDNGLITEARVVITPDQPLGIWHLNGLELAPLLDEVRAQSDINPTRVLIERLGEPKGVALSRWMVQQGWI
ncbi:alkylhalidase-like protein [Marinobacterium zhoushanense]|uniref:Alkylhalidase-like protein n=1 Tax=Marinobacterium zhoushanense TaxID=1679163 RepID=A0ABQ1K2H3_9GAMM|nr:FAD-dependent monooxygenase [Marinobacterium zhoushanense]GGB84572.1 alkylhalidase-like protein [Marinobacterium zhoushanense]